MSSGLSFKLPLARDKSDFFKLNKTYKEMIKQNLKMLILTNPGERVMHREYGVGLYALLFNSPRDVEAEFESRLMHQIEKYMPYVSITNIEFGSKDNFASFRIQYDVPKANISDSLVINGEI